MKTANYLVSNASEGPVCVAGRERIFIPALCKDEPIGLPEKTARHTIARLKQRYPLLSFKEVMERPQGTPAVKSSRKKNAPEPEVTEAANGD